MIDSPKMENRIPYFVGYVSLKSSLSLEELAEVLSERVFSGSVFGGRELNVHDEIPAVFITKGFFGLSVTLSGFPGFNEEGGFDIQLIPNLKTILEKYVVELDVYLEVLIREALTDRTDIVVNSLNSNS